MRRLIGIIALTSALTVPLSAEDVRATGPMSIKRWSIQWDRFKMIAVIDATFKNNSVKQISNLKVDLEFFNDSGKLVKKSAPWRKSHLSGKAETTMRLKTRCPSFQRYQMKFTGKTKDDFQQLFEGKYWPDRPGDTPDMPEPIVYAKGMADVRVAGSKTEYLKVRKGIEHLRISGSVQNMGDCPAKDVVITIKMLDKKKVVWTKDIAIRKKELDPRESAPFSVILEKIPNHTKIVYSIDFNSVKPAEETATIDKFDIEAGSLIIKDCSIDPKTGLFTGTMINNGSKIATDIVVNISVNKAGATTTYKIEPGGEIKPGDSLSLIKATLPKFDNFSVNVGFQEK